MYEVKAGLSTHSGKYVGEEGEVSFMFGAGRKLQGIKVREWDFNIFLSKTVKVKS